MVEWIILSAAILNIAIAAINLVTATMTNKSRKKAEKEPPPSGKDM
ncbi:hypothetical protein ACM26V_18900 [Salipaludibacillus sp. HK11]